MTHDTPSRAVEVTQADRDLATLCVPGAAIFADCEEHIADMRRRAAKHIARHRLASSPSPDLVRELVEALEPFANVAARIREAASDEQWLEQVLFYMGDDNDPTKWSLTGKAFDRARATLSRAKQEMGDA